MSFRIGLVGAGGRMGMALVRAALEVGHKIEAACERPGHAVVGADIGRTAGLEAFGKTIGDDPAAVVAATDVVIDFTAPSASVALAQLIAKAGKAMVLGTTGISPEQDAMITEASKRAAIVQSGNYSLGLNVLLALVERATRALPSFDIEIVELHHSQKVDAPSGTARMLGEAAAVGRDAKLADLLVPERRGHTGVRVPGSIGIQSLRAGTAAGEHTVMLAGPSERIGFHHLAEDRSIFARGAVAAALWLEGRPYGRYGVADVLGLKAEGVMLKLWGRANALNVRKVVWTLHELDVPFERIDAGRGYAVTDTADYVRMNPNRRVPTIDDDGYVLWELNAIVRYLCACHGAGKMYPTELRARFDAERWMDWAAIDLLKSYRTAFNFYTGNNPASGTEVDAAASFAKTNTLLAILDERLAKGAYLLGESFTMADIAPAVIVDDWMHLGRDIPGLPHVKAWYARLRDRPATHQAFWSNGTISIL